MKNIAYVFFLSGFTLFSCSNNNDNDCIDESKISLNSPCTLEYAPVCGCDEKTYSNPCIAKNNGVTTWTEGSCN